MPDWFGIPEAREEYIADSIGKAFFAAYDQEHPIGTKGTVIGVDDTASIMVAWNNGSRLHVIYGEDACKKI